MAAQVKKLHELGIVDASFVGLDSTPATANTKQNNPKSFGKNKFKPENHPKADPDCAFGVHSASNQHNKKGYEFYWGYKNHVLVDCISGLPLYELTTPVNGPEYSSIRQCCPASSCVYSRGRDKGYDAKAVYNLVKDT